ncbi:hypothetical protein M8C21_027975 [Ambrosia artemisiifolia]|uniref:Uncharacterized protein n=1 Tax=Ambrosia artemisiifolia TaxID=4212 RepID=A0AAD5G6F8_AMBAR|nr:hypothetical protein M8C21_027975 [Ambrosia artemisiifolia]
MIANLAEEAKIASEGVKAPSCHALLSVCKSLVAGADSLQRFCTVKPYPKEMKCDVELSTYDIRDAEEYKNFCDRPRDQRSLLEEVIEGFCPVKLSSDWLSKPDDAFKVGDIVDVKLIESG